MFIIIFIILIIIIIIFNKRDYFNNSLSIIFLAPKLSCRSLKEVNNTYNYTHSDLKLRNINSKIYYDEI